MCEPCEHREPNARFRCESCEKVSENLVRAVLKLKTPAVDRLLPYNKLYRDICDNCGAVDPKWITEQGFCNGCDVESIRDGIVCPTCANRKQHYCLKCHEPVEDRQENMLCIGCSCEEGFVPLKHSVNHHRICRECTRTGPVNNLGLCRQCYKDGKVKLFYDAAPYYTKCKTCDEPASSDSGYCKKCSKRTMDCVKCRTPVLKPELLCKHHSYNCCACGNKFPPTDMTELTCPHCIDYAKKTHKCAKCDAELGREQNYLASGICNECHDAVLDETTCRRCGTTKGNDVCHNCYGQKFPCMDCEKNMVHSTEFICRECKNKREE